MNSYQLPLFSGNGDAVETAIGKIVCSDFDHPNYQAFAREVATKALRARGGQLLLCAVPAAAVHEEVARSLQEAIAEDYRAAGRSDVPDISVLNTPSQLRRRSGATVLLDSYQSALNPIGIGHRRPPEFQLEFGASFAPRNQFEEVSNLIRRQPPLLYIVTQAQRLQPATAGSDVGVESVLMFAEVANQTQRTHILLGHTATVLGWARDPLIAAASTVCVLPPYFRRKSDDVAVLREVLKAYESIVPFVEGDGLSPHFDMVDQAVSGCVFLLRKWLGNALCAAKAAGEVAVTQDRLARSRLSSAEMRLAHDERRAAAEFLPKACSEDVSMAGAPPDSGTETATEERKPKKPRRTPGLRLPNRGGIAA